MDWKVPPKIKVFEALGAIADNRVKFTSDIHATVTSSSGNKSYDVIYSGNEIYANDNGSYWQGYLGYPAIACLMMKNILPFDMKLSFKLKGIPWKEINQKYKNDFVKTENYLYSIVPEYELNKFSENVIHTIEELHLQIPKTKQKPPTGW